MGAAAPRPQAERAQLALERVAQLPELLGRAAARVVCTPVAQLQRRPVRLRRSRASASSGSSAGSTRSISLGQRPVLRARGASSPPRRRACSRPGRRSAAQSAHRGGVMRPAAAGRLACAPRRPRRDRAKRRRPLRARPRGSRRATGRRGRTRARAPRSPPPRRRATIATASTPRPSRPIGLVVEGIHVDPRLAERARGEAGRGQLHAVGHLVPGRRLAVLHGSAGAVGQVLDQRAAGGHVQHLHARGRWPGRARRARWPRGSGPARTRRGPAPWAPARDVAPRRRWTDAGPGPPERQMPCRLIDKRRDRPRAASAGSPAGSPPADSIARMYASPSAISLRGGSPCGVCSTRWATRISDVVTPMSGRSLMTSPKCPFLLRSGSCSPRARPASLPNRVEAARGHVDSYIVAHDEGS